MPKIVVLPGDGIGPEIVAAALQVLQAVARRQGLQICTQEALIGGAAIAACGTPLPPQTVAACRQADAVLLGAVGDPSYDHLPGPERPEQGILGIRKELSLYANLRPIHIYPALQAASPLKEEIIAGVDILIVRELTGGIYFGPRGRKQLAGQLAAYDTEQYTVAEIERIGHQAFQAALGRGKRLCSIDKANVLESSRLWRETMITLNAHYPQVELTHLYVDNAAMQLVRNPAQFDVIVTANMFGDILSDEASQISGSIGLLPSASLGAQKPGLYEPIHGSAPDLAGQNLANPIATILSLALLLRHSLAEEAAAAAVEAAVAKALAAGLRTPDLAAFAPGTEVLGTREMAERIAAFT